MILFNPACTLAPIANWQSGANDGLSVERLGVKALVNSPCKLVGYDGAGHGFFNRGENFAKTLT